MANLGPYRTAPEKSRLTWLGWLMDGLRLLRCLLGHRYHLWSTTDAGAFGPAYSATCSRCGKRFYGLAPPLPWPPAPPINMAVNDWWDRRLSGADRNQLHEELQAGDPRPEEDRYLFR